MRLVCATLAGLASLLLVAAPYAAAGFVATFDGNPPSPARADMRDWDFSVHTDLLNPTSMEPMQAMHGSDCAAPPATHAISHPDEGVFVCRDHLMTAIAVGNPQQSGYGEIMMMPNQMVDFANGATIEWDVSTLVTSAQYRDWWDIWISPFDEHVQLPTDGADIPDLAGPARDAVHVRMIPMCCNGPTGFAAKVVRGGRTQDVPLAQAFTGYESFLTPSAVTRSAFQLQLSPSHITFGMPAYNFYWVDADIPALSWSQGVVQFGHHSYNPAKACGSAPDGGPYCGPDTWHWDNVTITPSIPFTLIRATQRSANPGSPSISFEAPAPDNAFVQFAGTGLNMQVSFDGGQTWQAATAQATAGGACTNPCPGGASSFWVPMPRGTSSITLRAQTWGGNHEWFARDASILAQGAPGPASTQDMWSPGPDGPPGVQPSPSPDAPVDQPEPSTDGSLEAG